MAVKGVLLDTNGYAAFRKGVPEAVSIVRHAPFIGFNTIVLPTNDMWIAASALQHGLAVFTYDDHFRHVQGITFGSRMSDFV